MTACMHTWTNAQAGSAAVEESSMPVGATGAVGWRLQHPGCGRSMRSHCKEIHGISNSIPLCGWHQHEEAMSSVNCSHHYGVEGTTVCQGSSWIHRSSATSTIQITSSTAAGWRRRWKSLIPDWSRRVDDQSIHKRAQFSNRLQELKQLQFSCKSNNNNKFQAFAQAFIKPATA